jgi:hypothetical protein
VRTEEHEGDGLGARFLRAPLIAHGALLLAVLLLLLPIVGLKGLFSADEGAALVQARHLADGHGWIVAPSFPAADPSGHYYPFELSARGTKGYAPYAKHPLYPVILAGSIATLGESGPFVVSIFGTVLAALLAAAMARRLDKRLAVPTLWVVGAISPLFFDSYLVIAHSPGAAMAALAAWAALAFVLDRRNGRLVLALLAAAVCILLRTEGLFLVAALAASALLYAVTKRNVRAAVVGSFLLGTAVVTHVAEGRWAERILGPSRAVAQGLAHDGGPSGKVAAFMTTWIRGSHATAGILAIAAFMSLAVAASIARRRPDDESGVRVFCTVAVVATVLFVVFAPAGQVTGLFAAFPLLLAGFVLVRRDGLRNPVTLGLWISWWLFAAAVLATQYDSGGAGEWGGRYFAIGLPLIIPVVLDAFRRTGLRLAPATRRYALVGLATISVLMSVQAVRTLRGAHQESVRFVDSVTSRAQVTPAGDGEAPVIVATRGLVPRMAWADQADFRWLLVPESQIGHLGHDLGQLHARLAKLGVDQAVVVGLGPNGQHQVHRAFTVTNVQRMGDWWVDTVRVDDPSQRAAATGPGAGSGPTA